MKLPKYHQDKHQCAPKDWRGVRKITGDYDFDASMQKCEKNGNVDAEKRISLFINRSYRRS